MLAAGAPNVAKPSHRFGNSPVLAQRVAYRERRREVGLEAELAGSGFARLGCAQKGLSIVLLHGRLVVQPEGVQVCPPCPRVQCTCAPGSTSDSAGGGHRFAGKRASVGCPLLQPEQDGCLICPLLEFEDFVPHTYLPAAGQEFPGLRAPTQLERGL
jgi:hypothetical protein